jgi:hypothetical protein
MCFYVAIDKIAVHVFFIMVERDGNDPSSCGFSDRRSDLISYRSVKRGKSQYDLPGSNIQHGIWSMAAQVGFEPTVRSSRTTVFKTAAINQTRPLRHIWSVGLDLNQQRF